MATGTATRLGLLRKHQGELRVTKLGAAVADDPVGLLATIASRVPIGRYPRERDAAMITLLITVGGDDQASWRAKQAETRLMAELLDAVGWQTSAGGKIMADDVGLMVSDDRQILDICAGGIDPPHIERRTEQFRTRAQLFARLTLVC